jgi:hypothetical protein
MLHFSPHLLLPRLGVSRPPPGTGWASTALFRSSRCWWHLGARGEGAGPVWVREMDYMHSPCVGAGNGLQAQASERPIHLDVPALANLLTLKIAPSQHTSEGLGCPRGLTRPTT